MVVSPNLGLFFLVMSGVIIGTKSSQSQLFTESGVRVPTTFIATQWCQMVGLLWQEKNGYNAIKLGLGHTKNIKKPVQGELNKAGIKTPLRFLKEIRLKDSIKIIEENKKKGIELAGAKLFIGDFVTPAVFFKKGDLVKVSGISKGKGFQGVVKRHHFKGGPRTHGQSHSERAPGSIGMTTTPGRVFRGKRMAGRMGNDRVTVKNLKVVDVKDEGLVVSGLVPGARGGLLEISNI